MSLVTPGVVAIVVLILAWSYRKKKVVIALRPIIIAAALVFFYWYGGGPETPGAIGLAVLVLILIYGWRSAKYLYQRKR